jgi:hypothetical protein
VSNASFDKDAARSAKPVHDLLSFEDLPPSPVIYGLDFASRTMMKSRVRILGCSWQALPVPKVA